MAGYQLCYSTHKQWDRSNICTKYLYIFSPCITEDLFVTKRVNIPLPAWWCHSWECRMFTHLVTHTHTVTQIQQDLYGPQVEQRLV